MANANKKEILDIVETIEGIIAQKPWSETIDLRNERTTWLSRLAQARD